MKTQAHSPAILGWILSGAATLAVLTTLDLQGCATQSDAKNSDQAVIERGDYLVRVGGCNDCHTPWKMGEHGPEPDMTRMLSGHPQNFHVTPAKLEPGPWIAASSATNTSFSGPWGVSFAANLTPDPATGLVMDEPMFKQALRSGKHMGGGRPILPPMPWTAYGQMTDDDLHAVYSYLRTIPAIANEVPQPLPPSAPLMGEKQ
ncbi:MAG: diheme cytochrome c-553 [Candidatus Eisenbacteria bacterium]